MTNMFEELSLDELRAKRAEMQHQEDAVSFVRRLAQGRLDIARDELRRRIDNEPLLDVATNLAGVFGQ